MELERTFDENVYSNVDDGSVFPLFEAVQHHPACRCSWAV